VDRSHNPNATQIQTLHQFSYTFVSWSKYQKSTLFLIKDRKEEPASMGGPIAKEHPRVRSKSVSARRIDAFRTHRLGQRYLTL